MKLKFNGFLVLFLALVAQLTFAQERSVSGIVSDNAGIPLPGVSILVKGTKNGTQSDFDGRYSIKALPSDVLVFSFIGMRTTEKTASSTTVNASLSSDVTQLESVVVTSLGIKRDKKSLGYATQEVKGESLSAVKGDNFVNAISGKVSGVQIKRTTNFGGSTNVVIRGNSSLTGNNQALFVIDGVPVSNYNSNSRDQEQSGSGYDYGNAASDINPEDIESINVLKGSAASALYGSRAANGVVVITTKKGNKKSKGYSITLNSGFTAGSIDKSTFIKYQNQYGAGYGPYYGPDEDSYLDHIDINGDGTLDNVTPLTEDASYGQAFDPNLMVYQWDAFYPESPNYKKATPWVNASNGPITFFETPSTLTNSISIDKGFENGFLRIGAANLNQSGLLPNSSLKRNTFTLNSSVLINEKLTLAGYGNFSKTNTIGRNSTGYNDNIAGNFRQWWQTNVDLEALKNAYETTGRNVTWNPNSYTNPKPIFWDNPYFQRYENYESDQRIRFIGNASLNYKINSWLDAFGRASVDTYGDLQEERRAIGSVPANFGIGTDGDGSLKRSPAGSGYSRKNISYSEFNYDFMLNYNKDITEKLNIKGVVGTNIRRSYFNSIWASTNGGLNIAKLYSLQNTKNPALAPLERDEAIGVDGIYGSASLGYDNFLFLEGTLRRDHSSTLPEKNSSYYYPSVSSSFVFSEFLKTDWLSFGKFRLNYAEVGNSPGFDKILDTYNVNTAFGASSASNKDTKNNPNLKPEKTKSYEVGIELSMFKKRLGLDLSYYKSNSIDQIIPLKLTSSTGYLYELINAGEIENKGIEVSLNGTPIKSSNFSWDVNLNWAKNQNQVVTLLDGIDNLQLGSFQGGVTINAAVGQPYGVIYGTQYTYKNGQRVVDKANGQYVKTSNSDNVIGNANPKWTGGLNNKFTYKNISFEFLIDMQHGGEIFSLDRYYGLATGLPDDTAFINDLGNPVRNTIANGGGFINPGVNDDGTPNATRIRADRFGAQGYRRGLPDEAFVYDASYVKLRQASISYLLTENMLKNTFINGITFSIIGTNLWIIDKNLPDADPESGLGSGNLQGYSTGSLPSTRDISFNVKVQF
ncbi:SusC/RagA family TonB-linked outer membrane protein [Flavobacterium sp. ZT3R18]|uniref:SusC/RagA family TonB-linked outer membrane protein n=1 Tax=Flavobacterium sp. ZT3R18 TaxID=2594429 RepID=UPI001179EBBD|nr:SusC/RagA family TonB-linked outer membrane protein [Flavobacterium sp. ZT3R18]TRX35576.1 SusC/RagA family TonB-linked outer membrane protein [Flavobacterium sp. ZT3R18]